jgi:lipopolysaccharide transport system ATP-binding protein
MGDDVVIRAEGLGKKYIIGHAAERERYVALRDVLVRGANNLWRKTASMARGRAIVAGDTVEEFWALKDVSFEVKRGEVLGIIGRNGAGKSTLLKILSRITEPSEGRVTIRGRVASLLEVGTGFHPELTGRENVYLNGAILGMTRAEIRRKFDEIVTFAAVEKFLDTPVKRYSSGMYVRLAFAVAAHLEPEILVVDEVLAVGDSAFQKKCVGRMGDIADREGRTVLVVSHNMALIRSLCMRGVVLSAGQNVLDSSAIEAINLYLHNVNADASYPNCDLTKHPNRSVGMCKYLQSIRIFSRRDGSSAYSLSQGEPFAIEIGYDASGYFGKLAGAGIIIKDQNGFQVAAFNTYMAFAPPHSIPARGSVCFNINGPPLNPGRYLLSCSIGDHQSRLVDKVEDCTSFEINQEDIYGTGYLLTSGDGVVALDCDVRVGP